MLVPKYPLPIYAHGLIMFALYLVDDDSAIYYA